MQQQVVFLNGQWVAREDARLDIEDRGTMFGDGVYEVLRVYGGHAYLMDRHLQRLRRSLDGLRFPAVDVDGLEAITHELCERNGWADARVYWQITRGVAMRDRKFPAQSRPTVLVMGWPERAFTPRAVPNEAKASLQPDCRWMRCWIKSLMLLDNVLARQAAAEAGADEAIYDRDGMLTEGTATNVFAVWGDRIVTPPATSHILRGVTRDRVIELGREAGLNVVEEAVPVSRLFRADEIALTGTTTHVTAVTHLDGRVVGKGVAGPMTRRLLELLESDIAQAAGMTSANARA